jgi:hypothetical protein
MSSFGKAGFWVLDTGLSRGARVARHRTGRSAPLPHAAPCTVLAAIPKSQRRHGTILAWKDVMP